METKRFNTSDIIEVKKMLKAGKVIAFPTDTVYGLGVIYNNKEALERLKGAKKRPEIKPIPMMVKNLKQLEQVVKINGTIEKLYNSLMPGALTIICKRNDNLAAFNANGLDTIAIRIPDDEFVISLLDEPMLVSSANLSGNPAHKNGEEVLADLDGRIDGIVMGEAKSYQASTIVDVTGDEIKILRTGAISETKIREILREE